MKQVLAEIITIGDEILYGQILDTNTQWISTRLDAQGIKVVRRSTVGDTMGDILEALTTAEQKADIILITGGLGPTTDDLTRDCLAQYFNCGMEMDEAVLAQITAYFEKRGRPMNEGNRNQALLPSACKVLSNALGTAPGMWFDKDGKVFVAMPGVPHEMKYLMDTHVLPGLKAHFSLPAIYHKVVRTVGIGESWLAPKIEAWAADLPEHLKLAYLPSTGQVRLRLTGTGQSMEPLKAEVDAAVAEMVPLIEKYVYGYDDTLLEEAIGHLLMQGQQTLATAESCTGGYVGHKITSIPGSSAYYLGGVVAYENRIKQEVLGVKAATLEAHGAVSEETVKEMAEGVKEKFGTHYGLATSGVAGPGGGTPEKPVGLVYIACAGPRGTEARKLQLTQDRLLNIQYSTTAVLNLLRLYFTEND